MKHWKYDLGTEGEVLRSLIENENETIENIIAIYNQLIKCLEVWKGKLRNEDSKKDWEYDIDLIIEDFRCACPDSRNNNLIYKEEKANLNYNLKDFYEMCDCGSVWIGL
nr:hypothetical protein [uncultured Blautia sp.]